MNNRMIKFSAALFAGTLFAGMFLILSYTMAFDSTKLSVYPLKDSDRRKI